MIYVTRREKFSAAHRLFNPELSDEENYRTYGKCSNPNWHGHNYIVEIVVAGEPDAKTGYVIDINLLKSIIKEYIIKKVDHKNLIKQIREKKWKVAIGINPKTPLEKIFNLINEIDQVLVMSVEPGFSGQAFLKSSIQRIDSLIKYREQQKLNFEIVVDGGISRENIFELAKLGVDQVAIDSAIFSQGNPAENLMVLKKITEK